MISKNSTDFEKNILTVREWLLGFVTQEIREWVQQSLSNLKTTLRIVESEISKASLPSSFKYFNQDEYINALLIISHDEAKEKIQQLALEKTALGVAIHKLLNDNFWVDRDIIIEQIIDNIIDYIVVLWGEKKYPLYSGEKLLKIFRDIRLQWRESW
jgi:hypothetical protein